MPWFWIDKKGDIHNLTMPISFKIDQTPPNIELKKQKISKTKVKFIATSSDATSGVEKVEFYLDDEIQTTVTFQPYEWIWEGTENHKVKAISYNYAGLQKESNTPDTPVYAKIQIFKLLFQRLTILH